MPRDTVTRFSSGDYVSPNADSTTTGARNQFWHAVKQVCPEAIQALHDDVYPAFERACEERPDLDIGRFSFERAQSPLIPLIVDIAKKLNAWAVTWSCGSEQWLLELAFDTLKLWRLSSPCRQGLVLDLGAGVGWSGTSAEERAFRFESAGWSPTSQHWADFESRSLEEFRRYLEKYRNRLSTLMEEKGAVRAPKKHKPEHLEWLVLFQLAGKSYKKIADEHAERTRENLNNSTIQQGVKVAAQLVGLRLRPGTRGPRRKV
jgi:hypothetical protein